MIVELLAVGTELLLGQTVNTNASTIGVRLADFGMDHFHQSVVGDNVLRIVDAVTLGVSRSDSLIITGGLGPTPDDLTRDALCRAAGVGMAFNREYEEELRNRWEGRGHSMPESNLRQAEHPEGADLIPNPKGSAPGLRMRIEGTWVFALPGVPAEMVTMMEDHVLPFLAGEAEGNTGVVVSKVLRTWGESESRIGEILAHLYDSSTNPTVAFLASSGEIKVRITAKADSSAAAMRLIAPLEQEVRSHLEHQVFGVDGQTIEKVVRKQLLARKWSIATAESATGGLIASRLVGVPGASDVFRGSLVAYDEEAKVSLLGVPRNLLNSDGMVSERVALAMAEGAARQLNADAAIAVTGAAGPAAHGHPPGTMIVAVRTPEDSRAWSLSFPGYRDQVLAFAATAALHLASLAIAGIWRQATTGRIWAQSEKTGG